MLLQEISNNLAKLSVYACARLGGYLLTEEDTTPDNPAVKKSLTALLTPYLAKKLSDNSPHEVHLLLVMCSLVLIMITSFHKHRPVCVYITDSLQWTELFKKRLKTVLFNHTYRWWANLKSCLSAESQICRKEKIQIFMPDHRIKSEITLPNYKPF